MKEWLFRTGVALENCQVHIDDSGAAGSDIEYYLAQHVLVIMYAEIEARVLEIAQRRMKPVSDDGVEKFIVHATTHLLKRLERGDLTRFVEFFGHESKDLFKKSVSEKEVSIYNNAIKTRHKIAHTTESSISFGELSAVVGSANRLLDALEQSIRPYKFYGHYEQHCPYVL